MAASAPLVRGSASSTGPDIAMANRRVCVWDASATAAEAWIGKALSATTLATIVRAQRAATPFSRRVCGLHSRVHGVYAAPAPRQPRYHRRRTLPTHHPLTTINPLS